MANSSAARSRRAWRRSRTCCAAGRRGEVGIGHLALAKPSAPLDRHACQFTPQDPLRQRSAFGGRPHACLAWRRTARLAATSQDDVGDGPPLDPAPATELTQASPEGMSGTTTNRERPDQARPSAAPGARRPAGGSPPPDSGGGHPGSSERQPAFGGPAGHGLGRHLQDGGHLGRPQVAGRLGCGLAAGLGCHGASLSCGGPDALSGPKWRERSSGTTTGPGQ
jgi:hypothetical protein